MDKVQELLQTKAFSVDASWTGHPLSLAGFSGNATPLGIAIGHHSAKVVRPPPFRRAVNEVCASYSTGEDQAYTPLGWALCISVRLSNGGQLVDILTNLLLYGASPSVPLVHNGKQITPKQFALAEGVGKSREWAEALKLSSCVKWCRNACVAILGLRKVSNVLQKVR